MVFIFSASRHRIQVLEAELITAHRKNEPHKQDIVQMLSLQASERNTLAKGNTALRNENEELRNELDELRAELEVYRAQESGVKGLVYPESLLAVSS